MLNGIKPCLEDLSICTIFLPKSMKKSPQVSLGSSDKGFVIYISVLLLQYFSVGGGG